MIYFESLVLFLFFQFVEWFLRMFWSWRCWSSICWRLFEQRRRNKENSIFENTNWGFQTSFSITHISEASWSVAVSLLQIIFQRQRRLPPLVFFLQAVHHYSSFFFLLHHIIKMRKINFKSSRSICWLLFGGVFLLFLFVFWPSPFSFYTAFWLLFEPKIKTPKFQIQIKLKTTEEKLFTREPRSFSFFFSQSFFRIPFSFELPSNKKKEAIKKESHYVSFSFHAPKSSTCLNNHRNSFCSGRFVFEDFSFFCLFNNCPVIFRVFDGIFLLLQF